MSNAGYSTPSIEEIRSCVLNTADYGVPQKRERLFIVGARDGVRLRLPEPTHADKDSPEVLIGLKKPYVTAGEAIGDLDDGTVREDEKIEGKWGHLLLEIPRGTTTCSLRGRGGTLDHSSSGGPGTGLSSSNSPRTCQLGQFRRSPGRMWGRSTGATGG